MLRILAAAVLPLVTAKTALLIVDVQDCFLEAACTSTGETGSLSVPACDIIPKINQIRAEKSCLFDEVIFTQDFHPASHISFGSTHGLDPFSHLFGLGGLPLLCKEPSSGMTVDGACCPKNYIDSINGVATDCTTELCPPDGFDYMATSPDLIDGNEACTECAAEGNTCFETTQAMWTDHCLQTGDSTFPPTLDKREGDMVVQKGAHVYVDAYSAFMDNAQSLKTALDDELMSKGIDKLIVAGIATDVCVQWTVTDALGSKTADFQVVVVSDATAPVLGDMDNFDTAIGVMKDAGASIITTEELLAMDCPAVECPEGCVADRRARRHLLFSSIPSCPDGCVPM